MSKEHEESLDSYENTTLDSSAEPIESTDSESEQPAVNSKFLAIKSALKQKEEEEQQEEMKLHIADKVKKMKSAKSGSEEAVQEATAEQAEEVPAEQAETSENAEETSEETAEEEPAETAAEEQESAAEEVKPKKSKKTKSKKADEKQKKSSKKKKKKKKTFGARMRDLFPKKGDGFFESFRKVVFLSSSVIFVICLVLIADYFWDNYQNALLTDDLRDIYSVQTQPEDQNEEPTEAPTNDLGEAYEYYALMDGAERLLAINPDVVGWISIPGTNVSYPILQKKDDPLGNEYYLERNINLEEARAGSIFLDFRNNFDYVIDGKKQEENSQNLIIYGHNMQDGSMFGGLKSYINYADYYSEHPIVELNSNYRTYQYKIFGMIVVDVDDETETKFDYWNTLNFGDEQAFYDYVNEVKRRTIRLNEVDVKYGDELLTLSTCNSTFSNGRLVLFARKVREGEDLYAGTESSTANPNVKWCNSYYQWHSNTYDPDAEFVPYG